LVSVLFADAVGIHAAAGIARSGGRAGALSGTSIRAGDWSGCTAASWKFIGDAVMAVWGAGGQEDDAERAVRAALDLTAAVSALGDEVSAPSSGPAS
jgi:class 3 adenylate cyclase